uniref:Uncharacterized protein n=1 Tax=Rhizophora mucronata TaxID=61149 RepID=A0A2P2NL32_RHIMU
MELIYFWIDLAWLCSPPYVIHFNHYSTSDFFKNIAGESRKMPLGIVCNSRGKAHRRWKLR